MHQKKGSRRTSWPWVPLEKMKRENERMREFAKMRQLESVRKREEKEDFVERRKRKKEEL